MHSYFVLGLLALSSLAQASDLPALSDEMAVGLRAMHGIKDLEKLEDAESFAFREEGTFLVSKKAFASQKEAADFCASKPGYHLTEEMFPGLFAMMALPFVNLREQMIMKSPVLGHGTTGVVAWASLDLSQIPEDALLSPREEQIVEVVKAGDYVMAWTDGDGGSGDGIYPASAINEALKALEKAPLAMSAICVEEKLRAVERGK